MWRRMHLSQQQSGMAASFAVSRSKAKKLPRVPSCLIIIIVIIVIVWVVCVAVLLRRCVACGLDRCCHGQLLFAHAHQGQHHLLGMQMHGRHVQAAGREAHSTRQGRGCWCCVSDDQLKQPDRAQAMNAVRQAPKGT